MKLLLSSLMLLNGLVLRGAQAPVALLDSGHTREFFALHYPACNTDSTPPSYYLGPDEYQRYFRGWEYVLQQANILHDIIHDADVTDTGLSKYRLLILSNTASLSDDQERAIQHWVIRGGRLLATFGSGYKDIVSDPRQDDGLKEQKGGTSGLHELWHDPMSKVFGSNPVNNGAGTNVLVTQYVGPTACLQGKLRNNQLGYGAESNLLIQRPVSFPGALGFVVLNPGQPAIPLPPGLVAHPTPAILLTRAAAGLVVYYAFAPEYLVSKEFNLPSSPACDDGQNWKGRSQEGRALMECTVRFLLEN